MTPEQMEVERAAFEEEVRRYIAPIEVDSMLARTVLDSYAERSIMLAWECWLKRAHISGNEMSTANPTKNISRGDAPWDQDTLLKLSEALHSIVDVFSVKRRLDEPFAALDARFKVLKFEFDIRDKLHKQTKEEGDKK